MSTQLKLRRGTTAQHSTFTGAEGEITVDTTKDTVVVHDGATAGGIPLAKESGSALSPTSVTLSSGTANGVAYLNGSKVLTTGSALTFDGSNLTASGIIRSQVRIDVYGSSTDRLNITPQAAGSGTVIGSYNSAVSGYTPLDSQASYFTWGTSGSEQMRLTSTGLGIGTSSPATALHIYRTATDAVGTFQGLQTASGGTGKGAIQLDVNGKGGFSIVCDATSGTRALTFNNNNGYGSGTTEAMRIDSSGNVGIGTSSPSQRLTVSGSIKAAQSITIGNGIGGNYEAGSIYADTNWGMLIRSATNSPATGAAFVFAQYNGTESMRIDTSGNLGLGVTPSAWSGSYRTLQIGSANYTSTSGYAFFGNNWYVNSGGATLYQSTDYATLYRQSGGIHAWFNAPSGTAGNAITFTQAMTLDASGNLLVGTTSALGGRIVSISGSSLWAMAIRDSASNGQAVQFQNSVGTAVGSITIAASSTAYNTSSDYRLKENIQPMQNALDVVAQLNPVTYNWKADGSDGQGFIAHELQAVVPDCVTGEKDAVDAEGKPVYQGVDTSFLVATLTKAIQEQQEQINQLKAEVAALKGA